MNAWTTLIIMGAYLQNMLIPNRRYRGQFAEDQRRASRLLRNSVTLRMLEWHPRVVAPPVRTTHIRAKTSMNFWENTWVSWKLRGRLASARRLWTLDLHRRTMGNILLCDESSIIPSPIWRTVDFLEHLRLPGPWLQKEGYRQT